MISQCSSCGPSFSTIPNGKLPSKSPEKFQGEHLKIKKLTFLINGTEVAGVMVAQLLLQLFWLLLLHSVSLMVSCGKREAPCLSLELRLGLPQPGVVPELSGPPMGALQGAAADRELRFLSYGRQEIFREGGGQCWKGRQLWGETALPGLHQPLTACLACLGPVSRLSARCPGVQMEGMARPGLEWAQKGCRNPGSPAG